MSTLPARVWGTLHMRRVRPPLYKHSNTNTHSQVKEGYYRGLIQAGTIKGARGVQGVGARSELLCTLCVLSAFSHARVEGCVALLHTTRTTCPTHATFPPTHPPTYPPEEGLAEHMFASKPASGGAVLRLKL